MLAIITRMIAIMERAAREAGKTLRTYFHDSELSIRDKTSHHDIVTKADVESQQIIKDIITKSLLDQNIPEEEIGFIGEENLIQKGIHTFVIDPVDGTSNFATGSPDYCTLIAYFKNGVLTSGIIYIPETDVCYSAEIGKGANVHKNGESKPMVMVKKELKNTFLYTSVSYQDDIERGIHQKLVQFLPLFRAIRMSGCAGTEFGLLAEHVAGAVILIGCSIWDIAPCKLILNEIGYEMYDWEGNSVVFDLSNPKKKYPFIACHPENKETLLAIANQS